VPTVVQQPNVPEAIRSLSTLESPDYVDVFTVASAVTDKSPEGGPVPRSKTCPLGQRFVVWRVRCGLRLEPRPSPDYLPDVLTQAQERDSHVRLPHSAHEAHPWVIAQIAPDFQTAGCLGAAVQGGRDGFASFLEVVTSLDPAHAESAASRALFWLRISPRSRVRLGRCHQEASDPRVP